MILFYCDDAGNTGRNLTDPSQPFHYLLALAVEESVWAKMNSDYYVLVTTVMPHLAGPTNVLPIDFELHAVDVWHRKKHFKSLTAAQRVDLFVGAANIIIQNNCSIVYGRCPKAKLCKYKAPLHPHLCAAFVCLESIARICSSKKSLSVVIADENLYVEQMTKDFVSDYRRNGPPWGKGQNLICITDNVHFLNSIDSRHMQLADMALWLIARNDKRVGGIDSILAPALQLVKRQVVFRRDFPY